MNRQSPQSFAASAGKLLMCGVLSLLGAGVVAGCASADNKGPGCASELPAGSYANSCSGCAMSGTVLSCSGCGDGAGATPAARLDTCSCDSAAKTNGIWNDHGVLKCGDGKAASSSSSECSSDSACSSSCSGDCYQCRSGSCSCGYRGVSGACIY